MVVVPGRPALTRVSVPFAKSRTYTSKWWSGQLSPCCTQAE
ncbi:hypothetical protein [Kitasatospora aureofaciens]